MVKDCATVPLSVLFTIDGEEIDQKWLTELIHVICVAFGNPISSLPVAMTIHINLVLLLLCDLSDSVG